MRSGARAYRPRSTDSVNSSAPDSVRAGSPAPRPPASLLRSRFRLRTSDGLDHRISETTKCPDLRIRGPCSAPRKRCYIKDFGGDEGDRTLDLRIANATLSQLSYVPTPAILPSAMGGVQGRRAADKLRSLRPRGDRRRR